LDDLPPPIVRGPYLQKAGGDRMTIRWRTPFARNSRVEFGAAAGQLTQFQEDLSLTLDHSIELTGLSPDTVYFYSVGDTSGAIAGNDADHWFRTSPSPGATRPSRFWLLGDAGTRLQGQLDVRDAFMNFNANGAVDLMVMLGDNAYRIGSDAQYQDSLFDVYSQLLRTTPLFSTRGNHEKSLPTYLDIFDFPTAAENGGLASGSEAYYSFDFGNVHMLCLDSVASDRSPTGAMATWIAADLAATAQPWVIVYFHHPPYTKGSHDSDNPS